MTLPKNVTIVEVGPRDGLQNEDKSISVEQKVALINQLSNCHLPVIEVGSFVSEKWVPQMANSAEVFQHIEKHPNTHYPMLVPNIKGLEAAIHAEVKDIAIFSAASETFSEKNINCSIKESIKRYTEVVNIARQHQMRIRGYLSCVISCPYEGDINPAAVHNVTQQLLDLGCYEVSLGDTIGVGTQETTEKLLTTLLNKISTEYLALHFHNTNNQALNNIKIALEHGIATIDSSIAGLGGCPYAPGASGNVATEDVLQLLNSLGIKTGVNIEDLMAVRQYIEHTLQLPIRSTVS